MKCPKCGSELENTNQIEDYLPDVLHRQYECPECSLEVQQTLSHSEWQLLDEEGLEVDHAQFMEGLEV